MSCSGEMMFGSSLSAHTVLYGLFSWELCLWLGVLMLRNNCVPRLTRCPPFFTSNRSTAIRPFVENARVFCFSSTFRLSSGNWSTPQPLHLQICTVHIFTVIHTHQQAHTHCSHSWRSLILFRCRTRTHNGSCVTSAFCSPTSWVIFWLLTNLLLPEWVELQLRLFFFTPSRCHTAMAVLF